ncbi:MAG: hypothetical protein K9H64_05705 [Bacteroidales bacterium]|nr:hypothetical protein [Bacteroidales bacterium]MCF8455796.1 hypothetical protein [Bacteroidales bacterium]
MKTFPIPCKANQWPYIISTIQSCMFVCLVPFFFQFAPMSGNANSILYLPEISSELSMQVQESQVNPGGQNKNRTDSIQLKVQATGTGQEEGDLYLYLFSFSVLVIIGLAWLSYSFHTKIKAEQTKYGELKGQFDILLGEKETNYKELAASSMNILKSTSLLASVKKRLLDANLGLSKQDEIKFKEIISDLKENVNSGKSWLEFDIRFQKVHQAFYTDLLKICPSLSPNDLKLCAFLKLNMSTKEISAITFQSVKTLTIARYRLRKKLALKQDTNLISYLSKI